MNKKQIWNICLSFKIFNGFFQPIEYFDLIICFEMNPLNKHENNIKLLLCVNFPDYLCCFGLKKINHSKIRKQK